MIHMLADDMPLAVLASLVEPAVIYDKTGTRVIGHFTPVDLERGKRLYAEHAARLDPEEIARRTAAGNKGRTLEEIKADFAARRATPSDQPGGEKTSLPAGSDGCAVP
jgi:hypothetical protein